MVREARRRGLAVTSDVGVHHVHLSDLDIGYFDPNCKLIPPLRSRRDKDALRAGLADGTIDAICSDHTPVDDDGKQVPFAQAESGATGLELLLPLTLKWAQQAHLPLPAALARVTTEPLRVLGLPPQRIAVGEVADLCVFDPATWWRVERGALHSQGKNTPMLGMELQGRVRYTLVGGRIVFDAPVDRQS